MSLNEIEAEIKKLALKDRATLAKWVVESLDRRSVRSRSRGVVG